MRQIKASGGTTGYTGTPPRLDHRVRALQISATLPECSVQDAEPEPTSYAAACTSQHLAVWGEAIAVEYGGLQAAGNLTLTRSRPKECNVVGSEWVHKW